jgi:hypothetical protein
MRPSRISLSSAFLSAVLAGTPAAHAATTCPANNVLSTPTTDFTIDNVNQVVTHIKTGLMWKQCTEGLSGANCAAGSATNMNWSAALSAAARPFAGYSDWRLPNPKELESIVETGCYNVSINETAFPNTPPFSSSLWSSTTYASTPVQAWLVDIYHGQNFTAPKTQVYNVRLVRGGQSLDSFDAVRAKTDALLPVIDLLLLD